MCGTQWVTNGKKISEATPLLFTPTNVVCMKVTCTERPVLFNDLLCCLEIGTVKPLFKLDNKWWLHCCECHS